MHTKTFDIRVAFFLFSQVKQKPIDLVLYNADAEGYPSHENGHMSTSIHSNTRMDHYLKYLEKNLYGKPLTL